jgi:uncharacterized protein (DUF4415 family)
MNEKLHNSADIWNDPDDAPELTEDFFKHADLYNGNTLVKRGRPRATIHKLPLTVRYDPEVVSYFRATGPGWQSRMNTALQEWITAHPLTQKIKI